MGGGIRSAGIGAHSKGMSSSGDDGGVGGGVGGLEIWNDCSHWSSRWNFR